MLKTLIKKQLLELFRSYYINQKTGKAKSRRATAVFYALMVVLFAGLGVVFYAMASGLGAALLGNGFNWLYFALMGLLSMALGVFGSVFNTYASVYLPKDNEQLMALPIPNRILLLSRLGGVYVTSLMYSAWIWIPVTIAYWRMVPLNALNVVFPVLLTFVVALFVTVLSCVLGWVVALIASRAKGKSFITLFLSIAVFALYYVAYFKIVDSIGEILNHVEELGTAVKSWLRYSYLLGRSADGDAPCMLAVTLITTFLAAGCFLVLSRSFTRLSSVSVGGGKRTKAPADYTERPVKAALVRREFKHFASVPTWMLNGGFGLLLLPIAAAAVLIKSNSIRAVLPQIASELPELNAILPVLLLSAVCFILSVNAILPVSVSMEGKTLWILQSLPLDPRTILRAKERMGVRLNTYPALVFVLVCGAVLGLCWWETALVCVAVWAYIWVIADFSLYLNLKMPNFNWTNVASLTKQSAPVVISMFGGWVFCAGLGVGGYFLTRLADSWLVLSGFIVLFALLWFALQKWLKTRGAEIFASM